jgi:hypothetical protein
MKENSDEELLKIVTVRRQEYQDEAILAAENELQSGNIPTKRKERYRMVAEEVYVKNLKKANESLEPVLKVLTVIFPMVITFILSGFYKRNGYDKRAKELVV